MAHHSILAAMFFVAACTTTTDASGEDPLVGAGAAAGSLLQIERVEVEPKEIERRAARETEVAAFLRGFPTGGMPRGLSPASRASLDEVRRGFVEIAELFETDAAALLAAKGSAARSSAAMTNSDRTLVAVQARVKNISQSAQSLSNITKTDAEARLSAVRNVRS